MNVPCFTLYDPSRRRGRGGLTSVACACGYLLAPLSGSTQTPGFHPGTIQYQRSHQVYRVDVDVDSAEIQSLGLGLVEGFSEKRL